MIKVQRLNALFSAGLFLIVLLAASFLKATFIIGSKMAFFSGLDIFGPLLGLFGGVYGLFTLLLVRYVGSSSLLLSFVLRHIPGLCGGWYWYSSSVMVRVLLPLVCMALFWLHPVGGLAYAYAFFWLIPVALYVFKHQSVFGQALGSTFVMHAVGSVIWLYTVPMTAAQWWGLIPVVVIERFTFALLQTGVVVAVKHGALFLENLQSRQTATENNF